MCLRCSEFSQESWCIGSGRAGPCCAHGSAGASISQGRGRCLRAAVSQACKSPLGLPQSSALGTALIPGSRHEILMHIAYGQIGGKGVEALQS